MKLLIILISLCVGCTAFEPRPEFIQTEFRVIFLFDENPMPSDKGAVASATWSDGHCVIRMKRAHYSNRCLGHEFRHCLEGDWHEGRKEKC